MGMTFDPPIQVTIRADNATKYGNLFLNFTKLYLELNVHVDAKCMKIFTTPLLSLKVTVYVLANAIAVQENVSTKKMN